MKRTSLFLPEDLTARLRAESDRSGVPVAELIRRACDVMTPPISGKMGELVKVIDQTGFLKVLVLDARDNKLLVSPGDDWHDLQIWVDGNLVTFPKSEDPRLQPMFDPGQHREQWNSLKLNLKLSDRNKPEEGK